MLKAILELEAMGCEFDFSKEQVIDKKITYFIKIPKKSEYKNREGKNVSLSYADIKNIAKKKLANAIEKTYVAVGNVTEDMLAIKVKVSAATWDQKKYDSYVAGRLDELK